MIGLNGTTFNLEKPNPTVETSFPQTGIMEITVKNVPRRTSSRLFDESRPEVVILIVARYDYLTTISARRGLGCR